MDCTGVLLALRLCTPAPEPPPQALAIAAEKPAQCLTQSQARAIYKTSHLYWHTANRCWDDQPTRTKRYREYRVMAHAPKPQSNPTLASALPVDPTGNAVSRRSKSEVFYPVLIAKQADLAADIYTVQQPITQWPLMLDIDAAGPDPDNGIDGCCWPRMETLK